MVYVSQQLLMPFKANAEAASLKDNKNTQGDSFLKVFDKSIRTGQAFSSRRPQTNEQGKAEAQGLRRVFGAQDGQKVITVSDGTYEKNMNTGQSNKTQPVRTMNSNQMEQAAGSSESFGKTAELTLEENLPEQREELQVLLDQIMSLLQKLSVVIVEAEPDNAPEESSSVSPDLTGPEQLLETKLSDLMKLAEGLEGTKTSEHTGNFMHKLQQLLGEDAFESIVQNEGQVSVKTVTTLQNLIRKMLQETEDTKMYVVSESIREIVIPAVNAQRAESVTDNEDMPGGVEETLDPTADSKSSAEVNGQSKSSGEPMDGSAGRTRDDLKQDDMIPDQTTRERMGLVPEHQSESVSAENYEKAVSTETVISGAFKESVIPRSSIIQQVVEKAETLTGENKSEIVVQLKPESLGKISLRVIHERGEIMAKFVAENEQVRAILESNMQHLKDSLEKSGITIQNLSVSVGQHGQRQAGDDNGQNGKTGERRPVIPDAAVVGNVHQTYRIRGFEGASIQNEGARINLTA